MKRGLFFLFLAGVAAVSGAAARPNILLIVSEDNGPELGCYGQPYVQTPVLDQLAEGGIRFERAYVPQAGCSQSRAALLTGLYPHQNGQIGLATWKFGLYDEGTPNLVRSLKTAGYRTGIIGKLHINPKSAFPFDFTAISTSNFSRKNPDQYAAKAKEFIEAAAEPFFLSVNYPDAHRPFISQVKGVPENPLTEDEVKPLAYFGLDTPELRRQTADYLNCMSRLDSYVGELLAVLEATGKSRETLVVYLGDHGADMLRGKRTSYEGGVRVPLILSWAGTIKPGQARQELVSTLDLMPTLLEVAGAEPVDGLPGLSLGPMFGVEETENWRRYLFTEYHTHSAHNYYPQRTVRDERYKLIRNLMPGEVNPGYAFTNQRFFDGLGEAIAAAEEPVRSAYERMERPPEFELYDLQADPYEFRNLADDPAQTETLARLQHELGVWRVKTSDPLLNPDNVSHLKGEIDACLDGEGGASKDKLELNYPGYFFSRSSKKKERKNVLFIAVDDLRPALGCYGDETAVTPHIDRLAERGTVFKRAYCQLAVCSPSRLSLMTGRRPDTTRVWDLGTHFREALADVVTLPQQFKNHGYHTRSIGKIYHGGGKPSKDPPSWSVDPVYDDNRDPKLRYATPENLAGTGLKRAAAESADVPDNTYIDGLICEEALTALSELKEIPFFLAVGFKKPHLPFCAPKRYWDLYERNKILGPVSTSHPEGAPEFAVRTWGELEGYTDIPKDGSLTPEKVSELRHGYYACVSYIDAQVGRLLDRLDELDLASKTIVCLWGDHGFHLGEQGLWTKANNYELSTRVPLILSVPGQVNPGSKTDALVELVDLYPTFIDACGLHEPLDNKNLPFPPDPAAERYFSIDILEGSSLLPLLGNPNRPWKSAVFSQYPRAREGNRHRSHGHVMGYAVRTDRYRYVEWREWESGDVRAQELYDHLTDPNEMRNLAGESSRVKILTRIQKTLSDGWRAALPPKS